MPPRLSLREPEGADPARFFPNGGISRSVKRLTKECPAAILILDASAKEGRDRF